MAKPNADQNPGMQVEYADKKFLISDESVKRVTLALERIWYKTLEWSERNPSKFFFIGICATFIISAYIITKVRMAKLQNEYDEARRNAKGQLPLPLPSPGKAAQEHIDGR